MKEEEEEGRPAGGETMRYASVLGFRCKVWTVVKAGVICAWKSECTKDAQATFFVVASLQTLPAILGFSHIHRRPLKTPDSRRLAISYSAAKSCQGDQSG